MPRPRGERHALTALAPSRAGLVFLSFHIISVQLPVLRLRDPVEEADKMAQVSSRVLRDDYLWNPKQRPEPHDSPAGFSHVSHAGPIKIGGKHKERHWQDGGMNRTVSDGDEDCDIEQHVSTVTMVKRGVDVAVGACVDEILHKQGFRVFSDMAVA